MKSFIVILILGSVLAKAEGRPVPFPGLLGTYPPGKESCFIAGILKMVNALSRFFCF